MIDLLIVIVSVLIWGILVYRGALSDSFAYTLHFNILTMLILFSSLLFVPAAMIICIIIFLIIRKHFVKLVIFSIVSASSLFIIIVSLPAMGSERFLGPFIALVILTIGAYLVSFNCTPYKYIILAYISLYFIFAGPFIVGKAMTCVYSPPAITESAVSVIKECVFYIRSKNDEPYASFHQRLGFGKRVGFGIYESIGFDDRIDEGEIKLSSQMLKEGIMMVQKIDDMILFYKNANVILPNGPGILYSTKGNNPNESENEQIVKAQPYNKIADNWYISKKLVLGGPRELSQWTLPEPLIDKSMEIKDEVLNELIMFSEENKDKTLSDAGN